MPFRESYFAGQQAASSMYSQADDTARYQTSRDDLLERAAGVQGLTNDDISNLLSPDIEKRAKGVRRAVGLKNGLEVLGAVERYAADLPKPSDPKNAPMPFGPLAEAIRGAMSGGRISPELAGLQIPQESIPALIGAASSANTARHSDSRTGQTLDLRQWIAQQQFNNQISQQNRLILGLLQKTGNDAVETGSKLGDEAGKHVLEQITNPDWPDETKQALAAVVPGVVATMYATLQAEAMREGKNPNIGEIENTIIGALKRHNINRDSKDKDVNEAIADLQEIATEYGNTDLSLGLPAPQTLAPGPRGVPGTAPAGSKPPQPAAPPLEAPPEAGSPAAQTISRIDMEAKRTATREIKHLLMIQLEKGVQKIGPDVKAIAQRAGLSKEDVMKIANDADAERARNKARLGSRDTLRGSAQ